MYAHREKNVDKNRITCESHAFYSYRFLAKKKKLKLLLIFSYSFSTNHNTEWKSKLKQNKNRNFFGTQARTVKHINHMSSIVKRSFCSPYFRTELLYLFFIKKYPLDPIFCFVLISSIRFPLFNFNSCKMQKMRHLKHSIHDKLLSVPTTVNRTYLVGIF